MPRLSLRTKLLIAFTIVLLPMLALIIYDYYNGYWRQGEAATDEQLRTSQAIGALVDASIDDAFAIAWAFNKDPVLRSRDSRQIDPYLASLQPSLPQYDNIAVLDLEGNAVGLMSSTVPSEPRPTAAGRRYFEAVKSTRQPVVSEILISRATGSPTVAIVVPMLDDAGALVGMTLASLDLDYLARRLEMVGLRKTQAVFVTDPEGMLAFHTLLPREEWGRRNLSDFAPVRSALAGTSGRARETESPTGDLRMMATSRTPEHGWVVGVSIPTSAVLGPIQGELVGRLLLFVAVLAFGAVVAFVTTSHFVVRPLETLAGHLRSFGQGRWGQRIDLRTGDEVELVAQAFNTMADRLQQAINEKGAAVEEAERRAEELNTIIGSMAEGVTIANCEGALVRVNRAAREILGVPTEESVPITLEQFKESDILDRDCHRISREEWPINRVLRGETFSEQELTYKRPDGIWINLLFAGSALRDDEGKVELGVNVFRDITAIRELERQREEFISVVAHDLRNAIAVVGGYSALLERLPPDGHNTANEQRAFASIHNGVRRLERMVIDLLDVSRIEARRLTLARKPVDLGTTVREIVQHSGELTKGHPVRVDVRAEMVQVEVDPDRIEQILSNLISNAGKYSYPNTEITVAVERRPKEVLVSVTNLGEGIPPEEREKLFTRWHRVRAADEEKAGGLGLGLYIAKGLVEAHGGRIWVESEPEKYATFRFTLPLSSLEAAA